MDTKGPPERRRAFWVRAPGRANSYGKATTYGVFEDLDGWLRRQLRCLICGVGSRCIPAPAGGSRSGSRRSNLVTPRFVETEGFESDGGRFLERPGKDPSDSQLTGVLDDQP